MESPAVPMRYCPVPVVVVLKITARVPRLPTYPNVGNVRLFVEPATKSPLAVDTGPKVTRLSQVAVAGL